MVAPNCFKISVNQFFFGNFKLPLWTFRNKLNFGFQLIYIIPRSTMKPEKMNQSEAKLKYRFPKSVKFYSYPVLLSYFVILSTILL